MCPLKFVKRRDLKLKKTGARSKRAERARWTLWCASISREDQPRRANNNRRESADPRSATLISRGGKKKINELFVLGVAVRLRLHSRVRLDRQG